MTTLATVRNRVLSMEGNYGANVSNISTQVDALINESYRELHNCAKWYWVNTVATIAATTAGTRLLVPAGVESVLNVLDPDGEPMNPRDLTDMNQNETEISTSTVPTYAIYGFDGSNNLILKLVPARTGNYTVTYTGQPAALSGDSDVIVGPSIVADFLVWRTYWMRIMGDKEQPAQVAAAWRRSENLLEQIKRHAFGMLADQKRDLAIPRG